MGDDINKIILIGAGGLAREVLWIISKQSRDMNFMGFIDEDESNHGKIRLDKSLLQKQITY